MLDNVWMLIIMKHYCAKPSITCSYPALVQEKGPGVGKTTIQTSPAQYDGVVQERRVPTRMDIHAIMRL